MNAIGDILRTAREKKGKSLDEIAAATRINKKFLQQIEANVRPNLPDTYYRAFLRSFAQEVGVDPSSVGAAEVGRATPQQAPAPLPQTPPLVEPHVLSRAESSQENEQSLTPALPKLVEPVTFNPATFDEEGKRESGSMPSRGGSVKGNQSLILFAIIILAVIALAAVLFWMRRERSEKPVQEISFADVLRDRESTAVQDGGLAPDTLLGGHPIAGRDSLLLEATTTDSVWVKIATDTNAARETVILPHGNAHWRARYKFNLSVGNAAAIAFTLNGKPLAPVSSAAKPVSNITYSWSTLDTTTHGAQRSAFKSSTTPADTGSHKFGTKTKGAFALGLHTGLKSTTTHTGKKADSTAQKKKKFPAGKSVTKPVSKGTTPKPR